jgi:hypothetical protein
MRNDHRRPLVAYGFVSLACALVVGQPSLGTLAGGVPGRAPVVNLLTDTGLESFGLPTINAIRAAVGEFPDDVLTPAVDPGDDPVGGTSGDLGVIVAGGPAPQSGPPLSAGLVGPGDDGGGTPGTGTPGDGSGGPPDDGGLFGPSGPDNPRGGKDNGVDVDGPMPHQFDTGNSHPYDTAKPPGRSGGGGGAGGGQDDDKPGRGPQDKGPKDQGPKDKGPQDKGPKDQDDKPGQGRQDKGDKPGHGPKDKGKKHGH